MTFLRHYKVTTKRAWEQTGKIKGLLESANYFCKIFAKNRKYTSAE